MTTEESDILPDGYKVKRGDGVYYLSYAMGCMSSIWGEDAEEFSPERWLNNGIFQPESPFKFVAFHVCIIVTPFLFYCVKRHLYKYKFNISHLDTFIIKLELISFVQDTLIFYPQSFIMRLIKLFLDQKK